MKTILFFLLSLSVSTGIFASGTSDDASESTEKGIRFFSGSWEEALQLAKDTDKILFLEVSTDWCGYCKRMKSKVYSDTSVGDFYNENFVNFSADAEKGEGIAIKKQFGVKGYPTLVYIKPDGTVIEKKSGYRNADSFIELGQSMMTKK
jgi:thioredoxin-related protein